MEGLQFKLLQHESYGCSSMTDTDRECDCLIKYYIDLEAEVKALKELAIWMTGCGYDFTQHEYFNKQRDALLLDLTPTEPNGGE